MKSLSCPAIHTTGVVGRPMRSKAGELSLLCSSLTLLAPCLHQLPKTPIESHQKRFRYGISSAGSNLGRTQYVRLSGFLSKPLNYAMSIVQKCGTQGVADPAVSSHS